MQLPEKKPLFYDMAAAMQDSAGNFLRVDFPFPGRSRYSRCLFRGDARKTSKSFYIPGFDCYIPTRLYLL